MTGSHFIEEFGSFFGPWFSPAHWGWHICLSWNKNWRYPGIGLS
jgi:hypothetical protein